MIISYNYFRKAEELKAKVSRHSDLLNNSEAWSDQQQLQTIYHQVLVLDLEYALDKKVEQELWTLGFKNHIAALQHLSRDKKVTKNSLQRFNLFKTNILQTILRLLLRKGVVLLKLTK